MNNEKRFVLFVALVFLWMIAATYLSRMMGWNAQPKKLAPVAAAEKDKSKGNAPKPDLVQAGASDVASKTDAEKNDALKSQDNPVVTVALAQPAIKLVGASELVLGSSTDKSVGGYLLEAQLEQKGAGIESVYSSRYDAELDEKLGRWNARKRPLKLIARDPLWPPSLAVTLSPGDGAAAPASDSEGEGAENAALRKAAAEAEDPLDTVLWEVVRENGRVVRTVPGIDPLTKAPITGQAVVFRTTAKSGVIVTKTIRLFPNRNGLEVELKFDSPDKERSVVYNLLGPHGIPIEGEWYTSTFRDVVFGQLNGKEIKPITNAADAVAATDKPIENTTLPLVYAGIENQYFAILVVPDPSPTGDKDRVDAKTIALVLKKDEKAVQKSDVGVRISSKPISIGPNRTVTHQYRVFAGPKTADALSPYGAQGLATYRKNQ